MFIVVAVVAVLVLGALALLVTARGRAKTGQLSRSTRRADDSAVPPGAEPSSEAGTDVEPIDEAARAPWRRVTPGRRERFAGRGG